MNYNPRVERGSSIIVTHDFYIKKVLVKQETREFSLNYFTRTRKKVGA